MMTTRSSRPSWRQLIALSLAPLSFLSFSALSLILVASPATAEATRPLVRVPVSIKHVGLAIPMPLKEATERNMTGLDLAPPRVREKLMQQAAEYIELRGGMKADRADKWFETCEKTLGGPNENPFCRYEQERNQTIASNPIARSASEKRSDRRTIADDLRDGNFGKAVGRDYQDVVSALGSIGDATAILPLARRASDEKSCLPSSVPTAMAYKLEELFPRPDVVELSKKLYRQGSSCGKDFAAATASFRLGLILIWQRQYTEVPTLMSKVESTPEASQFHARAKYWRFFCANSAGDEKAKSAVKETLSKDHPLSFQNLAVNGDDDAFMNRILRADDTTEAPQISMRSIIRPEMNGLIGAVEALIRSQSPVLAAELVDRSVADIGSLEPEVRLYTAALMSRIGMALPKFKILSGLFQDAPKMVSLASLKLMFPLWYFDLVKSKQTQVDPLLILSLIRQESAFNRDARSIVGARGLMQVMPATARTISKIRTRELADPDVNVGVGTKYFIKRLGQFSGDVELTLAAYNAGFGRVDQWLKRYPTTNKHLFLDFIPFRETREYVSSILRNYYFYTRLYGTDPSSLPSSLADASPGRSVAAVTHSPPSPPAPHPPRRVQAIMAANAGLVAQGSTLSGTFSERK